MTFADAVDEHVAGIVAEQIAAFKLNDKISIDWAWKALTGQDPMVGCLTWDHISKKLEDSYREINLLPPRKNKKFDGYYLRKIR